MHIDYTEIDEDFSENSFKNSMHKNFLISKHLNFHDFTDSFAKILKSENKDEIHSNRLWGQHASHILNMRILSNTLLEPIIDMSNGKMEIKMGILSNQLLNKLNLGSNCLMWFGKAVMFRIEEKNNFEIFQKIICSNLIFGELIYFSAQDVIYITLPTYTLKNVVKVK
jgi:hypothetical protein